MFPFDGRKGRNLKSKLWESFVSLPSTVILSEMCSEHMGLTMTVCFPGEASPQCPWTVRWVLLPMIKRVLLNMQEMEHFLTNDCGDINYTIVRPPGLDNDSCTGLSRFHFLFFICCV